MVTDKHQPSVSDRKLLRRFLRRTLVFVVPALLICAPAVAMLAWTGESFSDLDETIRMLDKQPVLTGYAYNEINYGYLKYRRLTSLPRQSVVALGSSRVLAFREQMFECSFYNAGYTISPITEFRDFLANVPDAQSPEILLIGLDQWMFNSAWIAHSNTLASRWTENNSQSLQRGLKSIPKFYKDLFRGRIRTRQDTDTVTCIGLNAVCNRKGFRNDGSFCYGSHVTNLLKTDPLKSDFRFPRGIRFTGADEVDADAVQELRELLNVCQSRNIRVIAFLPPFMDRVYDHMMESGQFEYIARLPGDLQPLFEEFDQSRFELHTFQSMRSCGSDDSEAIDGFHGSHTTYLKMLLKMIEQGSVIAEYTSETRLQADLEQRQNRYCVYGD